MAARRGRKQARRSGNRGVPGIVWAAGGVLVGLAIAGFVYFRSGGDVNDLLPQPNPQARPPAASEPPVAQDAPEPTPRRTRYDFYDVLRDNEVVFPDAELEAQAAAEADARAAATDGATPPADTAPETTPPAPAPAAGQSLLIQAGAFRNASDAEARKALIAMTGQIARVEPVTVDGATIYRVRLGPYPDASSLASAKAALDGQGIEAVAIRAQ
ncbi:SPOR domain-containing protein [Arenimonas composti]|uniref:SPOR domain-containing protein n=1 Tax=Arenimonas composti TR7-09 = DSM 18010 TaxID=1121013 RepID=A0A091BDI3_9GAMM|nr:SPOR domain-containing protein [Arenimonas composti]KFN49582.1 hypothetical protein P873_10535 [Arenimonas composti TR7-09 = DSM 18010]